MAEIDRFELHPGDPAPDFSLPGVDGRTWSLADLSGAPAFVVVFWCNHCPYVQAWEARTIALARRYEGRGVKFVLINANDDVTYPDDRFERMAARAKEKGYPFPYLRDDSQEVAHRFGARVTPHPMVFDGAGRLRYQGRIDDQYDHPEAVRERYLQDAIDAVLEGRPVTPAERPVLGCSVKWRA
ncbi:MAG: thioredoxin family protein [Thermoplasmata archaeon]|nr:thioredoxin family protein [Thermoplasmata archaeon]